MKILQVITRTDAGGAQMVAALLSNELVRLGHEVILVGGCGDGTIWKWLDKNVIRMDCVSLLREISPVNDIKTYFAFKRLYRKVQPDIIHLHSSKVGFIGRLAFPTSKTVFTVHGFDRIGMGRKLLERIMQYCCAAVVGVCENDRKNLLSAGVTKNVSYVFNGIPRPTGMLPSQWQIPNNKFKHIVLCVARLEPQKNHRLFYDTAKLLPNYAFVWIGNTMPMYDHPVNVFFLGTLPSASLYCQKCDVFCLPSNYEGLPMTIIEAMSYGKPIVSSNVGGVSEIVKDGINGYTLENDAKLFAEKIRFIVEDRNVYESMCHNSKNIYENKLTVSKMAEGYLNLYNRIGSKT